MIFVIGSHGQEEEQQKFLKEQLGSMQMLEERHAVFLMTFLSFVVRVFGFSFCLLGYFVYFPCINMGLPFCEKILPIEMHMIEPPTRPPISSLEFSLAVFPHDVVPVLNKN